MDELNYTLLAEGTSDEALMPILNWLLEQCGVRIAIQSQWADLARLPHPPRDLSGKIKKSLEVYPCNILFIHRDADNGSRAERVQEIQEAVNQISGSVFEHVCVIPVRMTEAWLLIDEQAIRRAAGNPNGRMKLDMPPRDRLEEILDPKQRLQQLLAAASGLSGRRRDDFNSKEKAERLERLARFIEEFSGFLVLRELNAFRALENDLKNVLQRMKLI